MKHIMLDLETYSTKPNACIISIGAVKFDGETPVSPASDSFHVGIVPTLFNGKFDIDPGTVAWWMAAEQDAARNAWLALEKTDIASALTAFIMWMNPADAKEYQVWGNGVDFDNVILRHAFDSVTGERTCPWSYTGNRCYRTMKKLPGAPEAPEMQDYGIQHTALADALWQARHLQLIAGELGIQL